MFDFMAVRAAILRGSFGFILGIFLSRLMTNIAPAGDSGGGGGGRRGERRPTSLHSGPVHANLIIFAQWKTPTKEKSWLKKAWRNPKQKPWFFVVGGLVLLTLVFGGYYLVRGVLVGVKECSI